MESDNLKFGSVAISWFLICIFREYESFSVNSY